MRLQKLKNSQILGELSVFDYLKNIIKTAKIGLIAVVKSFCRTEASIDAGTSMGYVEGSENWTLC
jgi:hypothetical protein